MLFNSLIGSHAANISSRISAVTSSDVKDDFGNIIIVDGKKVKLSNRNAQANIQALINNSDKVTKTFQVSGHYDKDSYNLSQNKIHSQKCPQFYEITLATGVTTITKSSDITSCYLYNSHSTLVKNHTPVFYGGRFCSNDTSPITCKCAPIDTSLSIFVF